MDALNLQFEFILLSYQSLLSFLSGIQPNSKNMPACLTCEIYNVEPPFKNIDYLITVKIRYSDLKNRNHRISN
jgi:hypothetical protein